VALAVVLLSLAATLGAVQAQAAKNGKVLILGSTVSGGASSQEAQAAAAIGLGADVVTDAEWAVMTTAQFAAYQALILGDRTCIGLGTGAATATANGAVWGPAVDGNVITLGTDEVYHSSQGGHQVTTNSVAFAADAAGKTGMMVSLSCYYHDTAPHTPVGVLAPFGSFTVTGVGCYNNAHIVATHPALTSLTDGSLSGWSCSVHEAFDSFPTNFLPLVIARNSGEGRLPGSLDFPDGSSGVPYILARGEGLRLVRQIDLTPDSATNPVGTSHTVTATVKEGGAPIVETRVTFIVLTGPNAGRTGTSLTNSAGAATFTYSDSGGAGTDEIQASYLDRTETLRQSNVVTKTWVSAVKEIPPADIGVTKADAPDPVAVGQNITYTIVVKNFGPGAAPDSAMSDTLPAGVTFLTFTTTKASCAWNGTAVKCAFGTLQVGDSVTVTIVVRADTAGTITNSASVSTSVADPNVGNNQVAIAATTVQGPFTPPAVTPPVATPPVATPQGCSLAAATSSVPAGVRSTIHVTATHTDGSAAAGVRITLRGDGGSATTVTNAAGEAKVAVTPKRGGARMTISGASCGDAVAVNAVTTSDCSGFSVTPKAATVGSPLSLTVRLRIAGKPAIGVRVLARGAGVSLSGMTSSAGLARLIGTAKSPGFVTVSAPGVLTCSKRIGVSGAFAPPRVTG
jgi:uncharacterized repeat protein (TIGR01451 family)